MMKVGLTGGMGAGKSTVARIFNLIGVPVYDSDSQAKRLMVESPNLVQAIKDLFGEEAYQDQQLNRKYIASRVFGDPALLERLNSLVHPEVRQDFEEWYQTQPYPYVLNEAALHFESGGFKKMDCMISVSASESIRIERILKRDNSSQEQVRARLDRQMPQSEKDSLADHVIFNDGEQSLIQQCLEIHNLLLNLSERK